MKETSSELKGLFTVDGTFTPPISRLLIELNINAHYSFDYAQPVYKHDYDY